MRKFLFVPAILVLLAPGPSPAQEEIPPIPRRLPPPSEVELPGEVKAALDSRVATLKEKVWEMDFKDHAADVGFLVKAVEFALEHGEFYAEKNIPVASEILDLAEARLTEFTGEEDFSWRKAKGLVARGFRSSIDDSYQPYGLEIPENLDLSRPVPLLVWLHGRGDKETDLYFIQRCLTKSQALGGFVADQEDAIILHPFGRQCVGWKHAGEIDVLEAIAAVMADYPIDPDRIALAGFSMGGAGAWHIGAHYRDRFCAVHTGAGFAETKEYNGLAPEKYPAAYVQTLWQVYDVPSYTRNLLNGPLLSYSGSEDKQKQSADLMARELLKAGHELRHVIGEGMGHKYDEASVDEIWQWLLESWEKGRETRPGKIVWETPTLRYPGFSWLQMTGLEAHWEPALAEAAWNPEAGSIGIKTENVAALTILPGEGEDLSGVSLSINGEALEADSPGFPVEGVSLIRSGGEWRFGKPERGGKSPGLQGPIDDAFMSRFIVVPPDKDPEDSVFARWVDFEMNHFRTRWKALMRGEVITKSSDDLSSSDLAEANLILWGDPESNPTIARMAGALPVQWTATGFTLKGGTYRSSEAVPVLIFPNPLNPDRYVVLNSGLTFRENHDATNSQQNPKLPDWAVVGLGRLPDGELPGEILEAGFFDENWE